MKAGHRGMVSLSPTTKINQLPTVRMAALITASFHKKEATESPTERHCCQANATATVDDEHLASR